MKVRRHRHEVKYCRVVDWLQVPANEKYDLEAMPVPVVMVALGGGSGGHVIERNSGREIQACEGGVFFLPAYTPVIVCSGSERGIRMALAHTNLHWGTLSVPAAAHAHAGKVPGTENGELSSSPRAPSFA